MSESHACSKTLAATLTAPEIPNAQVAFLACAAQANAALFVCAIHFRRPPINQIASRIAITMLSGTLHLLLPNVAI